MSIESIEERLSGLAMKPQSPDIRGVLGRLTSLQHLIPRLDMPRLPMDEDVVVRSIYQAIVEKKAQVDMVVTFGLPKALIPAVENGTVALWYTPQQEYPAWAVDTDEGKKAYSIEGKGGATKFIEHSRDEVPWIGQQLEEVPRVRILPEEVYELAEMISNCIQVTKISARHGTILEELNGCSLHPVDIFLHFAERRAKSTTESPVPS